MSQEQFAGSLQRTLGSTADAAKDGAIAFVCMDWRHNREDAGDANPEDVVVLTIAARLQPAGREIRMIVQNTEDQRPPDPPLLRAPLPALMTSANG